MKKTLAMLLCLTLLIALALPAFAATVAPSVNRKAAPALKMRPDGYYAVVLDKDGNIVAGIKDLSSGELIITSLSETDKATDKDMAAKLKDAGKKLAEADKLTDVCSNLAEVAKSIDGGVDAEKLVARDVFDISVYGKMAEELAKEGNYLELMFDLGLPANDFFAAMHYGSSWSALQKKNAVLNSDGSATLQFESLSPVAFVADGGVYGKATVKSPQTSLADPSIWLVLCAGFALLAAALTTLHFVRRKAAAKSR